MRRRRAVKRSKGTEIRGCRRSGKGTTVLARISTRIKLSRSVCALLTLSILIRVDHTPSDHEVKQTVKENYAVTPTNARHRIHPASPSPSSPITQVFRPALYQLSSSPKHTTSVCPESVLEQPSRDELFGYSSHL
jgi:hypothetical protein